MQACLRYAKFALLDCYEEFDGIIENFKDYPPASRAKIIAPVLREFYGAPPKDLGEMVLVRRRKHALDECPYCGHPLAPRTLDHFLPKEDWPEYAIFSNNLVPQCSDCAPIKGQRYYCTTNNQALFLHPMYSSALSTVRFHIDVKIEEKKIIFKPKFSILEYLSVEDERRIILHLKSLQVQRRIEEYCIEQYQRWTRIVGSRGCNVRASFERRLMEADLDLNARNWGIAFYQGVLNNPEVVKHLQMHEPHGPSRPFVKIRPLPMDD
jgi:hypothetical protein